jgi:hypothetical protein
MGGALAAITVAREFGFNSGFPSHPSSLISLNVLTRVFSRTTIASFCMYTFLLNNFNLDICTSLSWLEHCSLPLWEARCLAFLGHHLRLTYILGLVTDTQLVSSSSSSW